MEAGEDGWRIRCGKYFHPQLDPPFRAHAFHPPFEIRQFVPWVALCCSYGCFFGFLVPIKPRGWEAWTGVYVGMTGLMLVCGLWATLFVSPHVDPNTSERQGSSNCPKCGLKRIEGSRTHHCSACNRCADDFDHHCPWINTCVTDRTMPYFIGLLLSAMFIFVIQIAFLIFTRIENPAPLTESATVAGVVLLSLLPGAAIVWMLILLLSLGYFRLYLGMSTYEYLQAKGEKVGQTELDKEHKRVEDRRVDIEKEQAAIREEWRRKREKEQAERRNKEPAKVESGGKTSTGMTEISQEPNHSASVRKVESQSSMNGDSFVEVAMV